MVPDENKLKIRCSCLRAHDADWKINYKHKRKHLKQRTRQEENSQIRDQKEVDEPTGDAGSSDKGASDVLTFRIRWAPGQSSDDLGK